MSKMREIRKAKMMTLGQVADLVGVSIAYLSDVELGRRGARPETRQKIADALGVTVDELMEVETDDKAADAR